LGLFAANKQLVEPVKLNGKGRTALKAALKPEHKTYAQAGSPTGKSWTPFKETCRFLLEAVKENPGISLTSAVSQIKHHYRKESTAVSCMAKNLRKGYVPGVKLVKTGSKLLLFLN
jgi:hypothetical protein